MKNFINKKSIPFGKPLIGKEEKDLVLKVLKGTQLVHGPMADEFENVFKKKLGITHAITTTSCTAGLHLSLHAKKIGLGDKVIVPAMTHVATAHCVEYQKAEPLFIDIDPLDGNIDINLLIEALNNHNVKAINLVHYLGLPVDISAFIKLAKKKSIFIIEDCALALGAELNKQKVGSLGDVGCFSFYPVKHMTTAEGGMITTNDKNLALKLRKLKAFGYNNNLHERKIPGLYDVLDLGYNYRMSEIHSAIGLAQINKIDYFLNKREENFKFLYSSLSEINEIHIPFSQKPGIKSSYYCLNIVLPKTKLSKRNDMINYLKFNNIGVSVHYPSAIPFFSYYKNKYGYKDTEFPVASWFGNGSISLPVGPHLNLEDMKIISNVVKSAIFDLNIIENKN